MSKFNASVSTIGIQEVKVQQAIMKLLENSVYNREAAIGNRTALEEQIRRISQRLSSGVESESYAWAHVGVALGGAAFPVGGLVRDATATYSLKVTFRNTGSDERSCLVNGTTVTLAGGAGETASLQTTVSGNGSFTIDNSASTVDVFVRIWR